MKVATTMAPEGYDIQVFVVVNYFSSIQARAQHGKIYMVAILFLDNSVIKCFKGVLEHGLSGLVT